MNMKKIVLIVSSVLVVLIVILLPFLIKVQIRCVSQNGVCPDEVNAKLETLNSKSLFVVQKGIEKDFKTSPMVLEFSTQFKLPNILLVNVIATKALFAIKDRTTGKIYLVSKDGYILTETQKTDLPMVEQDGITPNLFALNIVLGVYQMYQVGYGSIVNDTLVVDMKDGFKVIFPLEGDKQVLLGSLRLIYSKIQTSNPNNYKQVDLRFKNPVLR
jgi:hypothetical protein